MVPNRRRSAISRVLVPGFGFSGYRSFYGPPSYLGPLDAVNVVAGQNNAGKSNILRFALDILPGLGHARAGGLRAPPAIEGLNVPVGEGVGDSRFELVLPISDDPKHVNNVALEFYGRVQTFDSLLSVDGTTPVVRFESQFGQAGGDLLVSSEQIDSCIAEWGEGWAHSFDHYLSNALGGGVVNPRDVMGRLLMLMVADFRAPAVESISASRRVEPMPERPGPGRVLSGVGIIDVLAELQNPTVENWEKNTAAFAAINRFAQTVMDEPRVRIHIPHDRNTILVSDGRRTLPLENIGTGLQQVIILAAHATRYSETLVCIEEPETHLHPVLQRQLVEYLAAETSNQYLIATHSAHILNLESAAIFHVSIEKDGTHARRAKKPHEYNAICADLGYRPADLLQSNAVIWVEGPSDRTYINAWLALLAPELHEQVHYSVMFYGGKLLSHLTVDPAAFDDFIGLRALNRHSVVVIDSDREAETATISATKRRIAEEYNRESDAPGFAWITDCYTIENYVPREKLAAAVASVHPQRVLTGDDVRWGNPLRAQPGTSPFDKIAIAREVVSDLTEADLEPYDLRSRLQALAGFIREANGLTVREL